jgi:non-specific serine/threonine protein kinase
VRWYAGKDSNAQPRHNLPLQPTTFVGRDWETREIRRLLRTIRLLTLTGPGGVGKTRLALRVAADAVDDYADGVWFIDLAPIADERLVVGAILRSLGLHEATGQGAFELLREQLGSCRLLLVLDNCEHVVSSCARLSEALLRDCAHLTIITTSRERLGIPSETLWTVLPLRIPPSHTSTAGVSVDRALEYEAVQLFVDRAVAVQPDFQLNTGNASSVMELCKRLDGIPLAIELAAPRLRLLALEELVRRMQDRFGLLSAGSRTAHPRHKTLRAAVEWSYDVLSSPERILFHRFAVFADGCTLEAAEGICCGGTFASTAVLELLGSLVDKSLIVVDPDAGGPTRYRLLETLREFAAERLAASGDDGVWVKFVDYFIDLAEQASPHLRGGPQLAIWLRRLHREQNNLRAALHRCVEREDSARGLRLGGAAWRYWFLWGSSAEGREWLNALLRLSAGSQRNAIRAGALNGAGVLADQQGDYTVAQALLEQSLSIWRDLGDAPATAGSLNNMGMVALHLHNYDAAQQLFEQALELAERHGDHVRSAIILYGMEQVFEEQRDAQRALEACTASTKLSRESGDQVGVASGLVRLGYWELTLGSVGRARARCEEGLTLARAVQDIPSIAWGCLNLGLVHLFSAEWTDAQTLLDESLSLRGFMSADDDARVLLCLAGIGWVRAAHGDWAGGLRLYSAAARLRDNWDSFSQHARTRLDGPPFDTRSTERWMPTATAALGRQRAARARLAGARLSSDRALDEAFSYLRGHQTSSFPHLASASPVRAALRSFSSSPADAQS